MTDRMVGKTSRCVGDQAARRAKVIKVSAKRFDARGIHARQDRRVTIEA